MEYLKRLLFYAGAEPEEYHECLGEIRRTNRTRLRFYLIVAIAYFAAMTVLSIVMPMIDANFPVYLTSLLVCIAVGLLLHAFPEKNGALLTGGIWTFIATLYLMAIAIGTYCSHEDQATSFVVFIVMVPLLFTLRPIQNIVEIVLFDAIFIAATVQFKGARAAQMDTLNCVCFGGISIVVSSYIMKIMTQNVIVRSKLRIVAENDLNTNMQNRNAYERRAHEYPLHCEKSLSCVYVDVNGLHELNNTKGHAEGDRMLQLVAQKICEEFGRSHAYRIGGDEFVAFVFDESHEEMQQRVSRFVKAVEKEGYSVAVGTATNSAGGIDVDTLVKTAEKRMYLAKDEYYRVTGREHIRVK